MFGETPDFNCSKDEYLLEVLRRKRIIQIVLVNLRILWLLIQNGELHSVLKVVYLEQGLLFPAGQKVDREEPRAYHFFAMILISAKINLNACDF